MELLVAAGAATEVKNNSGPGLPGVPEEELGGEGLERPRVTLYAEKI